MASAHTAGQTSRAIKFKAWSHRGGHWLDSEWCGLLANGRPVYRSTYNEVGGQYAYTECDLDATFLQFTGLHDKNGKEIYEGDIVKGVMNSPQLLTWQTDETSNVRMCGEVYYDHHTFSLKCIQSMCDKHRDGMVNYFQFITDDGCIFREMEVIGNIYENPDLLKEAA